MGVLVPPLRINPGNKASLQPHATRSLLRNQLLSGRSREMSFVTLHVFNHCLPEDDHALPQEQAWIELTNALGRAQREFDLFVHAFVLMSNHYHLLISSACFEKTMQWLLRQDVAKEYWPIGWNGRVDYLHCVILHPKQYRITFRYIAQNPIVSGASKRVEAYPFSTVRARAFGQALPFFIQAHPWSRESILDLPVDDKLEWLNAVANPMARRVLARAYPA